jgi:two-component system chemotaxis response regulator CheY
MSNRYDLTKEIPLKILIVDDSSTMRRIIINTLSRIGYSDVVEAEHGKAGLEKLGQGGVEMIITDWNMPEMDGLEFVQTVRGQNQNIPILMVTTNAAKEDIVQALQSGVNNYVVKPFTPETLKEKIESLLG